MSESARDQTDTLAYPDTDLHGDQSAADPNLGRVLCQQYRIDSLLERGGMGAVYRATQLSVNRPVAVKLIASKVERSNEHVERFRREAEAMAKLRHPNTIRLFDFGVTEQGQLFMVMELLSGRDLSSYMGRAGSLTLPQALGIVRQIAQSLSEAHAQGIVHRDLKPGNIFLSRIEGGDSFVKVMDFGIAGIGSDDDRTHLTKTGAIVGTPAYMSPEQAEGHAIDGRADLYSLGILLFEMLSGRSPFDANSAVSMLVAHMLHTPALIAEARPDLPEHEQVQALLDRLLAKTADERFGSAAELIAAVDALLLRLGPDASVDLPVLTASPLERSHQLPSTPHRTPLGWTRALGRSGVVLRAGRQRRVAIALAALIGCAGLAWFGVRSSDVVTSWSAPVASAHALWENGRNRAAALATQAKQSFASDTLAHVTIASVPSGASVRMAGAELGKTPYELQLKGPVEIELTLATYAPHVQTVTPNGEPNVIVRLHHLPPFVDSGR